MQEIKRGKSEETETRELINHALALAGSLRIKTLLVRAEASTDIEAVTRFRKTEKVLWIMKGIDESLTPEIDNWSQVVSIPDAPLSRMEQVKLSLLSAYLENLVEYDETVLVLSGGAGAGRLDTLVILNTKRDFPRFGECKKLAIAGVIPAKIIYQVIAVGLKFAAEGREGKPIGTILLTGPLATLKPYLRQLILNPCQGHPLSKRNVLNPEFLETWRELTALDGALIIDADGTVVSAGTYLSTGNQEFEVQEGLGARHVAAASVTATCPEALAVVISESSGRVRVFQKGKVVTELQPIPGVNEKIRHNLP